jgi:beta-glucosidase
MPRHEAKLEEEGREDARLLFIGNSITHGWENTGKEVWNEYYAGYGGYNIGFSGDRTENVLWRFQHGEVDGINPELAILMIGTNNTGHRQDPPECTAKGIEMILDELEQRLPDTEVLLLAIFPREASPEGELRQLNNEINNRIENLADGEHVHFLNINEAFLDEDGVLSEEIMPDLLHPNEYGYQLWAEAMQAKIEELLD